MGQSTLSYLKKRYLELEKEIADAPLPDHDLIVDDLEYHKAIIADEIARLGRLVQRFSKLANGAQEIH